MDNVRVTLYHTKSDAATLEQWFQGHIVDDTVQCFKDKWWDCVKHARQHKVQVWLETTGATGEGQFGIIPAAGPAPVGVLWAGFPGSMAMPGTLQYMVADTYTVPPDQADTVEAYPEKMLCVPGSWMIADPTPIILETEQTAATRTELREKRGIPTTATVYSYFGRSWKIDDKIFRAWAQIICNVPMHYAGDYSVTPEELRSNFLKLWVANGASKERLLVLPVFRRGEHLHVLKELCDVALEDTSIYSGGTTSYEALYAGLPMVHYSDGWKCMHNEQGGAFSWRRVLESF